MRKTQGKKHIIGLLVENEAGVLARIVGLFAQRGYNIETLAVGPMRDGSGLSRITISTFGAVDIIEQITKQLNKIVPVYKVMELSEDRFMEREVMLLKLRAVGEYRAEAKRLADIFGGKIVDVTPSSYIIELSATSEQLDAFLSCLDGVRILECARSGIVGLARGERGIAVKGSAAVETVAGKNKEG